MLSKIKQKIEEALVTGPCGRRLVHWVNPETGTCAKCGALGTVSGALVYGIAFVPFVFALLQQANMERTAVDPFAAEGTISRRAWRAGFVFLGAVVFYCMLAFSALSDVWYVDGSVRLTSLLAMVVLAIWMQQALTLRYISLRPELSHLVKNRRAKKRLCGHVISTFDARNPMNYIFLSVVVAEFLLFASVCFHSKLPWRTHGCRPVDAPTADWFQTVLPEFLVGRIDDLRNGFNVGMLITLLLIVLVYLVLLGDIVFRRLPPFSKTASAWPQSPARRAKGQATTILGHHPRPPPPPPLCVCVCVCVCACVYVQPLLRNSLQRVPICR